MSRYRVAAIGETMWEGESRMTKGKRSKVGRQYKVVAGSRRKPQGVLGYGKTIAEAMAAACEASQRRDPYPCYVVRI